MTWLLFATGLALLVLGANVLVDRASLIGARMGISSLIIGLTIVAFGTSAPELAVSLQSALNGQSAVAVGNVVGSNIFNVLFILGLAALITPLLVDRQLIRQEIPLMVGVSLLVLGLALDGRLSRWDGIALVVLLLGYIGLQIRGAAGEPPAQNAETKKAPGQHLGLLILGVLIGLGLLVLGADLLVDSAIDIARQMGISEVVIGLTIIAAGTSLPEVATSVVAALRGQRDIAVGNVVGSNIFNLLAVAGISALVADGLTVAPSMVNFDLPVMTIVAIACIPVLFSEGRIDRWEGAVFLFYYVAYTTYLILYAKDHDQLQNYQVAMIWVVIPLTVVTAAAIYLRNRRVSLGS